MISNQEYKIVDPTNTNENYVRKIISESKSQLLIPPRLLEANLHTVPPKSDCKMIGIFSSGSTGDPKCIWNSWDNLHLNGRISSENFEINSSQKIFILASPWHVAGLSWALMCEEVGAKWKLEAPYIDKIDYLFSEVVKFQPDIILTVPSVVSYISKSDKIFAERLIFGGGAVTSDMYEPLFARFSRITQSYGQSEAGGLISLKDIIKIPENAADMISNVGVSPNEIEISFQEDEIWISTPTSVASGKYFSGDLGFLDSNNDLHITGRSTSKSGNCNILTAISEVLHK